MPDEGKRRSEVVNQTKNENLTGNAQKLRREMTKEERHVWYDFLKQLPESFNRQKVIGRYIVDFYCAEKRLVVELDGSQHYETNGIHEDIERDKYLQNKGLTVLRYSNLEVNKNFQGVCTDILNHLNE